MIRTPQAPPEDSYLAVVSSTSNLLSMSTSLSYIQGKTQGRSELSKAHILADLHVHQFTLHTTENNQRLIRISKHHLRTADMSVDRSTSNLLSMSTTLSFILYNKKNSRAGSYLYKQFPPAYIACSKELSIHIVTFRFRF
jgi:hypothetical protein